MQVTAKTKGSRQTDMGVTGRILRAAWNGPFHAGPLTHPVTVGDALLKLFQTVWRGLFVLVLLAAAGALALWISTLMQPTPLGEQIDATARVDLKQCGKEQPLFVTFHNRSTRTIEEISFDWIARQKQRSSNLVTGPKYLKSDVIIPPGRTAELCWSMPELEAVEPGAVISYAVDIHYASGQSAD